MEKRYHIDYNSIFVYNESVEDILIRIYKPYKSLVFPIYSHFELIASLSVFGNLGVLWTGFKHELAQNVSEEYYE